MSPEPHRSTWRWLVAVGVVAAVAAGLGVGARATYGAHTTADEPYYLVTAQSLVDDGDLSIEDELAAQPLPYHELALDEQTTPVDDAGRRLSPHDPLLPVLLAPAMAVGGWVAAKVLLALLAGVTASVTAWVAVRRLDVDVRVAAVVTTAAFVGMPLASYATQVYPELPAALATVLAVAAVTATPLRSRHLVAVGVAVVALPWLAVKYVPVAGALAVVALVRAWRDGARRPTLLTAAGLAVAGVAYLVVHQRIYGGWTVYAAGDHFVDTGELSVVGTAPDHVGRARRLVGLLVDRDFGIAVWAPVWFAAPLAVAALWVERHRHRAVVLAPLAAGWLTATFVALTMHGFWSPGRQVVVVLPLLVLAVARLADRARPVLVAVAVAGVAGLVNWVVLAVGATTGGPTLVSDFATSVAPVRRLLLPLLPDGIAARPLDDVLLAAWAAVLVVTTVAGLARLRGAADPHAVADIATAGRRPPAEIGATP